jgi:hypothetical protein
MHWRLDAITLTEGLPRMSKHVVLLRVGIDAGCGDIQGPLFKDGS